MTAKRLLDLTLALPGALLTAPLMLVIVIAIKLDGPGPVFFRQQRVGQHGRLFKIWKFRTMRPDAEARGPRVTVGADQRVTEVGHWLRRYKLDELPQLINVIGGSMSLVGPRPEVPEYVQYYPDEMRQRVLALRPGLTDYAALRFRNEAELLVAESDPERAYREKILPLKLDLYERYARESSIVVDIGLILRTLRDLWR